MLGLGSSLSSLYVPQASSYVNEYSIDFDGTNDYFDTGSTFQTTFRASFTIGFWIKTTSLNTSAAEYMFGSFDVNGDFTVHHLQVTTAGALSYQFGPEGQYLTSSTANSTLNTSNGTNGAWTHIGIVVNKVGASSNTTAKIYVNGSDVTDSTSQGVTGTEHEAYDAGTVKLAFGSLKIGTSNLYYWEGKMDEIAIWNTALSDASMAVVGAGAFNLKAANGDYTNQSNLVSHWRFIEGENTSVEDATTNSDGTLVNGAAWGAGGPS